MKKEKFNLGKFFKTLVVVGMFAFVPLVFVGCQIGGGGGAAKEYSISYVLNGGTNSDSNPTKIDKDMGDVWLQNPTREGYYFYGWYKDKYFNQQISKLSFDDIKGDLTLYAVWHPISYSITYELNGGEDKYRNQTSYTIEDFVGKGDIERDILLVDPTREGYAFAGWYLNEDFFGEAVYGIAQGTRGDLTLYAKWTSNTYTVKFNKNSDRASGSMSDQTFTYGTTQSLSDNKFTRVGYAFAGWQTDDGKKTYADEAEVSNLTTEKGGMVELFAVWKAIFTTSGGKITGLTTYGKNLTTIEIPSKIDDVNITEIGAAAFNNCDKLTSISIPNSVTKIGNNAFYYCSELTEITIPASVELIDYCAFMNCGKLTSIELPSKLTEVANGLFNGCSGLTSIAIPNSVTKIGDYAFYRCSSLTTFTIPSDVTSIGSYAFQDCSKLASISIPSKVATIGEKAFRGCSNLTEIMIPSSVTSIGQYVFKECGKLATVFYGGTETEWKSITIDKNNSEFYGATRYYYVEIEADVPADGGNYWHYVDGVPTIWSL